MLRNTFIHLHQIGCRRERDLWNRGILDWAEFLKAITNGLLSGPLHHAVAPLVHQSVEALGRCDIQFFSELLPQQEAWRLYPEFAAEALFLDIETSGLSAYDHDVTLVGAFGGGELALFINGINLDEFPDYVARFPLLITFNGSTFDMPFLRAHFPTARLTQPHIDLRFVLASLGYHGGLKAVERALGIRRDPAIQAIDGFVAMHLWHRYFHRGEHAALEQLALYNLTDAVNLIELMAIAVQLKTRQASFPCAMSVPVRTATPALPSVYLNEWIARSIMSTGRPSSLAASVPVPSRSL